MYGELKSKILELRGQGHSYDQIKAKLGCSKGTICFHCAPGQKEKSRIRSVKRRSASPLTTKIEQFCCGKKKVVNEHYKRTQEIIDKEIAIKLRNKMSRFFRLKDKRSYGEYMFTSQQLLEKIGSNPACYLTGQPIDLNKSRSYHLDHIVPKSRGGDDSLDNCQIACREANQAKGDLLVEEFLELCKKIIEHNQSK
jgi:5-methylcytosine-specific restriction endonuclease McrA